MDTVIEKPGKAKAPSDLANVSGFLFTPDIFNYLEKVLTSLKPGEEFYYNDALRLMMADGHRVLAKEITDGTYYDTGSKLGWLKANVDFALADPKLKNEFQKYLRSLT
jgi:UTP--glucose-1-phosphate uridylyltransferase